MNSTGKTYLLTAAALLGLLAATIAIAYVNLGPFNTIAALGIAALKAALIALFFMHLRRSPRNIWIAAATGLFWLGILLTLSLNDFLNR